MNRNQKSLGLTTTPFTKGEWVLVNSSLVKEVAGTPDGGFEIILES